MIIKAKRSVGVAVTFLVALYTSPAFSQAQHKDVPINDLQRFTTVIDHIRKYYVKPVNDTELFENAIRGMLSGLDPHSSYLDPNEFSDLKVSTSGRFGGLGIEVTMEDGVVKVISPIDDTPADRAGIKAGDMIIRLNDVPIKGMSLKDAVEKMRGERGSAVNLTIFRKTETKPLQVKLVRDIIKVKSVRSKILDDQYGYVRISQFQTRTSEDLQSAIESLRKTANNQLKGIILDLRNNPGGVLDASVKTSDLFLDKPKLQHDALIVYTEGRLPGSKIEEKAATGDILKGKPIVVIINEGSASAAEIVAGALQDHKRALIVGNQTFGKGSVQTVLPLRDQHGLKLTTALYYTPSGRSIQAKGISPDIEIPNIKLPEQKDENSWIVLREQDLSHHLNNGKTTETEKAKTEIEIETTEKETSAQKPLILEDYQLNEALNLLKALAIIGGDLNTAKAIALSKTSKTK